MNEDTAYELSAEGRARIDAVDGYLEEAIGDGRPIEALIATRRLAEIADARAREAARVATEGTSSWTDVGRALGVSKQAAHEKLRSRIQDKLDKQRTKLEQAEQAGHAKIARRAQRGREKLDQVPFPSPQVDAARQRLTDWERRKREKLGRDVHKAHEELARAEQTVRDNLDKKDSAI
jgi:hypothetical protein